MPTSGSSSRSSAIRCSADRPCSPNASRSPRTSRTRLSGRDPAQRRRAAAEQPQPGVAGQLAGRVEVDHAVAEQGVDVVARPTSTSAIPVQPERHHVQRAVLVGRQPDRGRLHPQRHVLGDQHDLAEPGRAPLGGQVQRAGEDAGVVAVAAESRRQHRRVGVVELDVQGAARVGPTGTGASSRPCSIRRSSSMPQRLPGEPAELGVVALALQLADHHQRQDHLVLVEPGQRPRVGQQDRGVEHVTAGGAVGHGCSLAGAAPHPLVRWAGRPWRDPRTTRRDRAGKAREGRVPAPSGVDRHQPGPPRAVRIGYVPPPRTISAVAPVRSTATRTDQRSGRAELTLRSTIRR